MAEKGILMTGAMVRAWMAGRKTQTRRVVKPQPNIDGREWTWDRGKHAAGGLVASPAQVDRVIKLSLPRVAPYQPDDVLWFRETCRAHELPSGLDGVTYIADDAFVPIEPTRAAAEAWCELYAYRRGRGLKVPGIHMPRWAARNFARVKAVRVERVQDISYEDAIAEGVPDYAAFIAALEKATGAPPTIVGGETAEECAKRLGWPQRAYRELWDSINAEKHPWESNPWVFVYELEKLEAAP